MQTQNVYVNLKAAFAGAFAHPAPLFRFVVAALGLPFLLVTIGGSLSNNLPWSFWAATLSLFVVVMCIGFLRFTRESHEAEDISISPDRR